MKISIGFVSNKGVLEKEYLSLFVQEDTDLGEYVLLCTGYKPDSVTTGVRHALWFADGEAEKGDAVVILTRKGKNQTLEGPPGKQIHLVYWGLEKSIWGEDDRAPVLLYAPVWESKKPIDLLPDYKATSS